MLPWEEGGGQCPYSLDHYFSPAHPSPSGLVQLNSHTIAYFVPQNCFHFASPASFNREALRTNGIKLVPFLNPFGVKLIVDTNLIKR